MCIDQLDDLARSARSWLIQSVLPPRWSDRPFRVDVVLISIGFGVSSADGLGLNLIKIMTP